MKRLYPGVFGRIIDLCQPKNTKHHLAITVALGKHMDSIVVENEKVGFQCIEYLKEQRVGTATFIPLDAIKTRPLEENLRNLGKRMFLFHLSFISDRLQVFFQSLMRFNLMVTFKKHLNTFVVLRYWLKQLKKRENLLLVLKDTKLLLLMDL